MKFFIEETLLDAQDKKNAGGKAREDIGNILESQGYKKLQAVANSSKRADLNTVQRLFHHYEVKKAWQHSLRDLVEGDELVVQFPLLNHTLFFNKVLRLLKRRGVKTILLIHDLESLRWSQLSDMPLKNRLRLNFEEQSVLKQADGIIAHNDKMKSYIRGYGVDSSKITTIDIFDYLIPDYDTKKDNQLINLKAPIIIAGNLKKHKAGYVYHLPSSVDFNLYGIGYEPTSETNVTYHGSFMPDDLPFVLEGNFGLVWDGPSADSCTGTYGEYLKVNNPHKTSLYFASGIPVVIWSEAAMASFIQKHQCGIVVSSLAEIDQVLSTLSELDYQEMKQNAEKIGTQLRTGYYTQSALAQFQ